MSVAVDSTQWNICSGRHSNESENSRIIKKNKNHDKIVFGFARPFREYTGENVSLGSLVNYHSLVYIFKKW